jgi:diadenosine tetraphosphate (Ap4A) HIT family hydrolase
MTDFSLHPQLAADTVLVEELPLCSVRLMNDKRFPWFILVPKREGVREVIDLTPGDQALLWQEVAAVSRQLQLSFKPDKLNIAALGNMVPQLHVHVIARFKNDAAWPKPVWSVGEAQAYSAAEKEAMILRCKSKIG